MKKNLLCLAVLASLSTGLNAQQIFAEDFDGNGPGIGSWTVIDVDQRTVNAAVNFVNNAWVTVDREGEDGNYGGPAGNFAAASTSWYDPAGASNDWLISPVIDLSNAINPRLKFQAKAQDADFRDGYQLKVAPNGGNTVADFTDTLYSTTGENSDWTERVFGLSTYNGQSIRIAWVNNSNDQFMLLVDDISVEETPVVDYYTLPFTETFEANSTSREFWTNINVLGNQNWTYAAGSSGGNLTTAYNGALNARFYSGSGTNSPITKLVSPKISAGTSTEAYLEFHHANPDWAGDVNPLKVYYRLSEDAEWVELFSQPTAVNTWTKQQIQLPAVSTTMQFAFEGINNWGRANVIDDVKVKAGLIPMVTTLPFHETFEEDSTTRPAWTQVRVSGAQNWTFATGSSGGSLTTANNGNLNARFYSGSGTNSPITRLITPIVDAGTANKAYLEFNYAQPDWAGDNNSLKVYYRTSDSSDWVQLYENSGAVDVWTQKRIALPEVSREMQFAFEGINNWGRANVIDDVQIIEGELPPLPEVCGVDNVSNNMENGIGNTINFTYANDFRVNAASKIDVSQISFNLITATSGISTATFSIVEDENGVPGDEVVYTFTGAPTATQAIGQNLGFSFSKYIYDLPEVVSLENTTNTHKRYWLKVEGVQPASGTNAYWEVTSVNSSEFPMMVFNETAQAWIALPSEGVFTIVGECSELEVPQPCEQSTPSNNLENGIGNTKTFTYANDFKVTPETQMDVTTVSFNLVSQSSGITGATIKFYEDNNGIPGQEIYTFTGAPTATQSLGTNFGFNFSKYTIELPEVVTLENGETTDKKYWMSVSGVQTPNANAYFETSTVNTSAHNIVVFNSDNQWQELTAEGVFSVMGECSAFTELSVGDQIIEVNKLSVYPNPVTDVLYIKHKLNINKVEVYNLAGQNVLTSKVKTDGSINLANLPKGVYVVNATLADGTNQTFKVIKK